MNKRSLLFVPVYNEVSTISIVLKKALSSHVLDLILIVDDASTDGTIDVVNWFAWSDQRIQVFSNVINSWKACWFIQAFEHCLNYDIDYLFMCDADLLESKIDIFDVLFGSLWKNIMSILPYYEWNVNWIEPNSIELSWCRVFNVKKFNNLLKVIWKAKYLEFIKYSRFWLEVILNHVVGGVIWLDWPKLSYIKLDADMYPVFKSPYKWNEGALKAQVEEITRALRYLNDL